MPRYSVRGRQTTMAQRRAGRGKRAYWLMAVVVNEEAGYQIDLDRPAGMCKNVYWKWRMLCSYYCRALRLSLIASEKLN